ncbi:DnaJ domain-containing protein [Danxiaibacter flavus]|uniref:DnaJ domain-containing protein n=1 Tax=Danxiaibacter flavus TaxID=3049108 RepID=A0ABV3ZGQ5_9BACT|nr:DnaJ domain-containing protein [Chitinophagaceae bacterium DXS]
MTSKDYYDILHVHPRASHEEIKRSYRKLALKFHPDKTNNDHLASLHFKEIKEAYEILSNQRKREAYNYERFFKAAPPKNTSDIHRISPEWILKEATELRKKVQATDPFRINADGLFNQLKILLSEYNLLVLKHDNKMDVNEKIIDQLLAATRPLPESLFKDTTTLLNDVAQGHDPLVEKIQAEMKARKWKYFWQKYKIVAVILIALILCWLIYAVKL